MIFILFLLSGPRAAIRRDNEGGWGLEGACVICARVRESQRKALKLSHFIGILLGSELEDF